MSIFNRPVLYLFVGIWYQTIKGSWYRNMLHQKWSRPLIKSLKQVTKETYLTEYSTVDKQYCFCWCIYFLILFWDLFLSRSSDICHYKTFATTINESWWLKTLKAYGLQNNFWHILFQKWICWVLFGWIIQNLKVFS